MKEEGIQTIVERFLQKEGWQGIRLYSCRLTETGTDFQLEIELDNLQDPNGALSIDKCVEFSRSFVPYLDSLIESQAHGLPNGLTQQNYSLGVFSAGTNRRIRIPEDLERFQHLPLEVKFFTEKDFNQTNPDKKDTASKRAVEKDIFKYQGQEDKNGNYRFETYQKKTRKRGKKKPPPKKILLIPQESLLEVRLYLDT